jgi:transposase InsO family protein
VIDRGHPLPLCKQTKALRLSRGSAYYRPRPVSSRRHPGHTVHPYLLRGLRVDRPNQVWAMDITGLLKDTGVRISMDGKGSWRDNVFIERLWKSVKYEEVYLKAYETVAEPRKSIGAHLEFYNGRRPHSSLDHQTPDQSYGAALTRPTAA